MDKGKIPAKKYFLKNAGLFFSLRQKIVNNFRIKIFTIKNLNKVPIKFQKQHLIQQKQKLNIKHLH